MTPDSPPARRAYRRLRVPARSPFGNASQPTPLRTGFLGMLAETGSVIACGAVPANRHGQCDHWDHSRGP